MKFLRAYTYDEFIDIYNSLKKKTILTEVKSDNGEPIFTRIINKTLKEMFDICVCKELYFLFLKDEYNNNNITIPKKEYQEFKIYSSINNTLLLLLVKNFKSICLERLKYGGLRFTEPSVQILKKFKITKEEIMEIPKTIMKNNVSLMNYITETFTEDEIVENINQIPFYLNRLFQDKQFSKENLKLIINESKEFNKKSGILGNKKLSIRDSSFHSLLKNQTAVDNDVVETFYNRFIDEDKDFVISNLQFIKKTKQLQPLYNKLNEKIKLLTEVL